MAFNPFTSFRKYQRFWMAVVLLLCMITFVLCTGVGGDLSQRIIDLFRPREGNPMVTVNGRKVYSKELTDLKEQRNMANEFMKKGLELAIKNIHDLETNEKLTPEQRQKELPKFTLLIKPELEKRYIKPRYFGSGVKLDDLLDFMVWQVKADELGIKLLPEHVWALVNAELQLSIVGTGSKELLYTIIRDLRPTSHRFVSEAMVLKALNDEFRARIARLALEDADPGIIVRRTQEKLYALDPEVRIALSPGMLWDTFKANRAEFDVTLLPVEVEDFIKKVPEPTEEQLKSLFTEYAKKPYDPTAPTPGFEIPASARVELIIGDPGSAKFKLWSKAAILMEATPPGWIPSSPLTTLTRFVGGPLAFKARLEQIYERSIRNPTIQNQKEFIESRRVREEYLTAAWNQPDIYGAMAAKLAGSYPEAAAAWIAGYAQPSNFGVHPLPNFATAQLGYIAFGAVRHPVPIQAGLAEEVKERTPVYATVVLSALGEPGYQSLALPMWEHLNKEKFFPLEVVLEPLTAKLERRLAELWVHEHMDLLRKKLKEFAGKKPRIERELKNNLEKMGVERRVTKDFYDRFTIDKAPELRPLVKAFHRDFEIINRIEGRDLHPETMLKEGDFYKLFFEATETFSAAASTYNPKAWPPTVTLPKRFDRDPKKAPPTEDLFDKADTPMLYWRIEEKQGKMPESIDLVRDRVEKAWKFLKARETEALPRAKAVADRLQKSEEGFGPVLADETAIGKKPAIVLSRLAPMYTKEDFQRVYASLFRVARPGERDYAPFTLPKDTFVYPRDDMAKEILSLRDLKKPVEIKDAKLDDLNKALFEIGAKNGRVVQILTNKPRSIFCVACVTDKRSPLQNEFHSVLRYAYKSPAGQGGYYWDHFFDRAFDEAGKQHQRALMDQLRIQTESGIMSSVTADEKEKFDANEAP